MTNTQLDSFVAAYTECALWSSMDNSDENGGDPLDLSYTVEDIAPDTLATMVVDCERFLEENANDISEGKDVPECTAVERAGHDFWLTRNGHGAGFWDGDWPEEVGRRLTLAAETYGECSLYVGDDDLIYCL